MLSVWSGVLLSCETGWAVTPLMAVSVLSPTEIQKLIYIIVLLVGEIAVVKCVCVCGWLVTGGLPAQILWPFWKNVGMESE